MSYADNDNDGKIDVVRNATDIDGDGDNAHEIREERNYYPFGGLHKGYNDTQRGTPHNYGYNGKEEQNELGLEWLDFGARNYNAALGRWFSVDELAENYYSSSPYAFVGNNPMTNLEIDGRFWIRTVGEDGTITYTAESGDSAQSLYEQFGKQDGITQESANALVEGTLGPNYIRESDGMLMSDVEVGDALTVYTEQAEAEVTNTETTDSEELKTTETSKNKVPNFGIVGDITGANGAMQSQSQALDIYEAEGLNAYLYFQIGSAHKEEFAGIFMGSPSFRFRGRGSRGQRGTTNKRGTTSSSRSTSSSGTAGQTVTVSGQTKTVQTGPRGGKYYINKNGNKTYLNRDGTKRN